MNDKNGVKPVAQKIYAVFVMFRLEVLKRAVNECRAVGPPWLGRFITSATQIMANCVGVRIVSFLGEGLQADPSRR